MVISPRPRRVGISTLVAQCKLTKRERNFRNHVGAAALEYFVLCFLDVDIQVASASTFGTGLALVGYTQAHAVFDAGGDVDFDFGFLRFESFAAAVATWIFLHFTRSMALGACRGHAEEALATHDLATAAAGRARDGFRAVLAT